MLIINADDWGRNRNVTENSLVCFRNGRVTSASAMVFMADSEPAAERAKEYGVPTGLHLNFTLPFDGRIASRRAKDAHHRLSSFLRANKYYSALYSPTLRKDFQYLYAAQFEEYLRLFGKEPTHIDGHHHMHLCTNMIVGDFIPRGAKVRRSFSHLPGETAVLHLLYRKLLNLVVEHRYLCTDMFFSIEPCGNTQRLMDILRYANSLKVELMVHPERNDEFSWLMSDEFAEIVSGVARGSYESF